MSEIVNYNRVTGGITHFNEQEGLKVTMFNLRAATITIIKLFILVEMMI